jgi:thioesterase domain-containing protein
LAAIWVKLLNVESVGVNDDFFELGGHSLLAIALFAEIEREFGKRLPVATLFRAPTIEKLAPLLRQEVKPGAWSPLVTIQGRGSQQPFFCIHGFGGGVVGYRALAKYLGEERPFYGLQARGQKKGTEPDTTIEQMAARYAAAIREKQPHGPYSLGGYCYGGTVALEVAQQLMAQGETISFLAMFENPAPKSGYRRFRAHPRTMLGVVKNLPFWLGDFADGGWQRSRKRFEQQRRQRDYSRKMQNTGTAGDLPRLDLRDVLQDVTPVPPQHQHLIQVHVEAIVRYKPKPYTGKITVFRTRRQPLLCSHDPYLGWRVYAPDVEVRMVAGSHHNLLDEPHVESLARELADALNQAS